SVTEKLMDELAQCYNVLPQLDINNTIDHRPEGDEKWFLENEKTVTQFCRKLAAERPLKDIRDEYNYPKKKGIKDECSRLLEASTILLVICKNAYLFATMIMTSVSSPFSCCSGIVRLNLM